MTNTELRQAAQDEILYFAMIVFEAINDPQRGERTPEYKAEVHKQFGRIEKLFGYAPGTSVKY